jgi:hypothetical protein
MNFVQLHERLRVEMLRRIERGTLSVSLLARQTGFGQPHLSNFLHGRKQLSLAGMDRILAAQRLTAADLLPVLSAREGLPGEEDGAVPVVTHAAALFERSIRPSAVQSMLHLPAALLASLRPRPAHGRRAWQRFVAVRVEAADAQAMEPLVQPEALALLDRHYNSLAPYRANRLNLYAVRQEAQLRLRYVELELRRLVLRPHNLAFPVELIDADAWESPGDVLAGRVALLVNEV